MNREQLLHVLARRLKRNVDDAIVKACLPPYSFVYTKSVEVKEVDATVVSDNPKEITHEAV